MPNFDVADRVFTAADRLEEIAHMIVAGVKLHSAFRERFAQQFFIARTDMSTRYKNPSIGPEELDAVGRFFSPANNISIRDRAPIDDRHSHAVSVFAIDAIFRRGV